MEYWIWLNEIMGLGPIIQKRLLDHFKAPKSIYDAYKEELMVVKGVGEVLAKNIIESRSLEKSYFSLEEMYKKDIKLLTYNDSLYPSIAKEYEEAPTLLYYRGSIRENIEGVAIVGSRRCSNYGKEVAIEAAEFLAKNNIPVISGMAKGIDGYAHVACLKSGGYTIAFLGNGVDICYPSEHRELMEGIMGNGAIISEYPPGTKARAEFFPKRNGLISSWSKKILVVEGAEKSGALITANMAMKQGKEVLVPPHEIYSNNGKGTNRLLSEGAKLYLNPSQLNIGGQFSCVTFTNQTSNEVRKDYVEIIKMNNELSPIEEKILSCIKDNVKTIEEISHQININQVDLIHYISIMELEGKVRAAAGGGYRQGSNTRGQFSCVQFCE